MTLREISLTVIELFTNPPTPVVTAGNTEVRKFLCGVTFIPNTGNQIQLNSSMYI